MLYQYLNRSKYKKSYYTNRWGNYNIAHYSAGKMMSMLGFYRTNITPSQL